MTSDNDSKASSLINNLALADDREFCQLMRDADDETLSRAGVMFYFQYEVQLRILERLSKDAS